MITGITVDRMAIPPPMRITSKGQVTVPKALRERFGITRETDVRFVADGRKLVLVKEQAIASPAARIR